MTEAGQARKKIEKRKGGKRHGSCELFAGWIIWGVKKNTDPEEAAKCAKWAWIGVGVGIVANLILGG